MKIVSIAAAAAALTFIAGVATADKWDMPTPYGDANFHTANIKRFAEDVKAATGGQLEIVVHAGGSLFKHADIKNAVRGGQVPIGEFLLSRLSNENPVFQVDSVPFLATDYDNAMRLWDASRPKVEELLGTQGLKVLFSVPWPPQGLYAKKAIDSVADMKGLKFRAYNASTEQLAILCGMVPTQIEVPDIPQAFATGRVDAMMTSPSTGANSKAWDFLTHFYHTQAWLPKNVVVVNGEAFDRLDAAVQKAVLDAAAVAQQRGWKASMAETDEKIAVLEDNGMTVAVPGPELRAGLVKVGTAMTEQWAGKAGADGAAILEAYE